MATALIRNQRTLGVPISQMRGKWEIGEMYLLSWPFDKRDAIITQMTADKIAQVQSFAEGGLAYLLSDLHEVFGPAVQESFIEKPTAFVVRFNVGMDGMPGAWNTRDEWINMVTRGFLQQGTYTAAAEVIFETESFKSSPRFAQLKAELEKSGDEIG